MGAAGAEGAAADIQAGLAQSWLGTKWEQNVAATGSGDEGFN